MDSGDFFWFEHMNAPKWLQRLMPPRHLLHVHAAQYTQMFFLWQWSCAHLLPWTLGSSAQKLEGALAE